VAVVGSIVVEYLAKGAKAFIAANREVAMAMGQVESKAKTVQGHLDGMVAPLSAASKTVMRIGDNLVHAGQVFGTFAYRMTLITVPITGFLLKTAQAGMELEYVMAKVQAELPKGQVAIEQFTAETTKAIVDLSTKWPIAADDIAEAMYLLISSMTIDPETARAFLEPITMAATAGDTTAKTVSEAVAVIMNAYKMMAGSTEENVAQVMHIMDVLFAARARGRAEYEDFVTQVGDFIAMAKRAGATFEEAMAIYAEATRITSPAIAATWIKRLYAEMTRPKFMAAMKEFGVQMFVWEEGAEGVVRSIRPSIDILRELGAVLAATKDEQEKLNMVHEAFGRITAVQGFLVFLENLVEVQDWVKEFEESVGLTAETAEIMLNTVKSLLLVFRNVTVAIGEDIFLTYKEDIKRFLVYLADVFRTLREMDPEIKKNMLSWLAFLSALGPVALVFSTLLIGLGSLITMLGALISPLALGGAIIGMDLFGDLLTEARDAIEAFGGGLPGLVNFVASLAVELGLISQAEAEKALEALGIEAMISTDKVAPLADEIRGLVDTISEFADKVKMAAGWIAEHFETIKAAAYAFIGVWGAMKLLVWAEQLLNFALAIKAIGSAALALGIAGGPLALATAALLTVGGAMLILDRRAQESNEALAAQNQGILEMCQTYEEYVGRFEKLISEEYAPSVIDLMGLQELQREEGMLTREEFERQKETIEDVIPSLDLWAKRLEDTADVTRDQIIRGIVAWCGHLNEISALFELNTGWLDELMQKAEELVVVSGKAALIALAKYAEGWGEAALDFARYFQEMIESQEEYERRRAEIMATGVDKTAEEVARELKILEEAWAKEQEAQRKHLGQMLMQQIDVWATMDETVAEHALEMKLVVAEQFGIITEEAAEMASGTLAILEEWRRKGASKTEAFAGAFEIYIEALQRGETQTQALGKALDSVDWDKELVIEDNLQAVMRRAKGAKQAVDAIKSKTVTVHFERTGWTGVQEESPKIRIQVALEKLDAFLRSTVFGVKFKAAGALDTLLKGEALQSTIEQMREFVEAFAKLVVWYDELWDKVVKKSALEELELVFGGLGKMAETLVALSELADITVPSLEELFALLEDLVDRMATFVVRYDEMWDNLVKKHAIEELGMLFDVIARIGDALESLIALTGEGVGALAGPTWHAGLQRFFDSLDAFISEFVSRAEVWRERVDEQTVTLAGWVGETVTSLTAAIDPLIQLADYAPDQAPFKAGVDLFFANLEYFLDEFAWGMWRFKDLAGEKAAETAELMGRILGALGKAIQPLLDLGEYAPDQAAFRAGADLFFANLEYFLDEFAWGLWRFEELVGEKVAATAELMERIVGALGKTIQPLLDLAEYSVTPAEFARAADLFFDHLARFIEMFAERAEAFDANVSEEVAKLAETIGETMSGIGAAVQPLIDIAEYAPGVEDIEAQFERFFYHLGMVLFFLEEEARRWQVSEAAKTLAEAVAQVTSDLGQAVGFLRDCAEYGTDNSAFALLGFIHFLDDLKAIILMIAQAGSEMVDTIPLAEAWAAACCEVLSNIQRGIDKLNELTGLGIAPENLVEAGRRLIESLMGGMQEQEGEAISALIGVLYNVVDTILSWANSAGFPAMYAIGQGLINSIIAGLWSQASALYNTVWAIVQTAIAAAEAAAEMGSDSKRAYRLGVSMVRGLIGGIRSEQAALQATLSGLAQLQGFSLQPALAGVGAGVRGGEVHYHNDQYYTVNPRYEQVVSPADIRRDLEALEWQKRKNRV